MGTEGVSEAMWHWILSKIYNNPKYDSIIQRMDGKKLMYMPTPTVPVYNNASFQQLVESNAGRNDIKLLSMWAMNEADFDKGEWGFFAMCRDSTRGPTTSMVGMTVDCDQDVTMDEEGKPFALSASASYMLAQASLPFASPGHLRGLTMQRLFAKVLTTSPPHLMMSSFNELVGGRQPSSYKANTAINMGLPYDAQNRTVWADTYGSEFSRDMEPSVEGGDKVWRTATSCVQMYKAGRSCSDPEAATTELCCTTADKKVFGNIWSLRSPGSGGAVNSLVTKEITELTALQKQGWTEQCNPVPGPTIFCVNTSIIDGREGPFILYNQTVEDNPTRPLYRCITSEAIPRHFISIEPNCESLGKMENTLGHVAINRGGEMLRALRRCVSSPGGRRTHALDLLCDTPDYPTVLGYVR